MDRRIQSMQLNPLKNALSLLAITLAAVLLGSLLLLSNDPGRGGMQGIDQKLDYLVELDALTGDALLVADEARIDAQPTISELADRFELILGQLTRDLSKSRELGPVGYFRDQLAGQFVALTRGVVDASSDPRLRVEKLATEGMQLTRAMRSMAVDQSLLVASLVGLDVDARALATGLRSSGRAESADAIVRNQRALLERLRGADAEALQSVPERVAALREPQFAVGADERRALAGLADEAEAASTARLGMLRSDVAGKLAAFSAALEAVAPAVGAAHLRDLYMLSDARTLLNVYTVMLLLTLGYFGVRLSRSYRELNASHDELEERVQERTQEVEQALTDLQESQVQLVQAEKMSSLGQLVAGVMHEINTPLLYVMNNASMTSEAVSELDEFIASTLPIVAAGSDLERQRALQNMLSKRADFDPEIIEENVEEIAQLARDNVDGLQQIAELVQSLKDFSRLDRAAEDRFNVVDGLEKTLVITRNLWKYGITVEKRFDEVPDIYCSPSRLNQVFINLITNAVQAMGEGGELTLSTSSRGDWVEVVIEDTGCGIAEENLSKIMDPFFTTKPVGKGTGLGLSIVHKIVQEHEGQLLIDSRVGVGSRFTLGLPVRRSEASGEDDATVSLAGAEPAAEAGTAASTGAPDVGEEVA
ncbi:MAG: ATP-binding protein [Pseudomonadota bacterium]